MSRAFLCLLAFSVVLALATAGFLVARSFTTGGPRAIAELRPGPPEAINIRGQGPDFSDTVLHWQNYSYSFDPSSPDPANGKEIVGDIWLKIGPANKPVALRGTFKFADGSFHQEYLYVDGQEIVAYDRPLLPPDGPVQPPNPCRQESTLDAATFDRLVDTGEPFYADRTKMAAAGFARLPLAPTTIPALEAADLPAKAEARIGEGTAKEVWVRETPDPDGTASVTELELDSDSGNLRVERGFERATDGSEATRYRSVKTAIEIFASEAVSTAAFSPGTVAAGC